MQIELPFTSGIPDETNVVELSFSLGEVMAAKCVVRTLIRRGLRAGPVELLTIGDVAYDRWLEEDAIRYLKEQKERRLQPVAVVD